jgi:hypothetical protein
MTALQHGALLRQFGEPGRSEAPISVGRNVITITIKANWFWRLNMAATGEGK